MERNEYKKKSAEKINKILISSQFNNFLSQMKAKKLGAEFKKTYLEKTMWGDVLFLSTNASMIFDEKDYKKYSMEVFKKCAEIFELFSEISEEYDKEYCRLLSALCYDISGYQANALCMIKKMSLEEYVLESKSPKIDLEEANLILSQIKYFLLKTIPYAHSKIPKGEDSDFLKGIKGLHNSIFYGDKNDYFSFIKKAHSYYLNKGDLAISQILFLFIVRIKKYEKRSIWNVLQEKIEKEDSWKNYTKILTNDLYDGKKIKDIEKRTSKFEFWISQIYAISQKILDSDESFVVQMPTSTGKTFIAELTILDSLIKNPKKKCIYIAPFRSLTNQVKNDLAKNLSLLGYNISTLVGSYDSDEFENIIIGEADVLVATPEKIDLLYRMRPEFFDNVSLLVVDEGHIVGEWGTRSSLTELLIAKLKLKIKALKTIFISAVMSLENSKDFSLWIANKSENVIQSPNYPGKEIWEPTRKIIGFFSWQKNSSRIDYPLIEKDSKIKTFVPNYIKVKEFENKKNNKIIKYPKDKTHKGETACSLGYSLSDEGNCLIYCSKPNLALSAGKKFLELIELYDKFEPEGIKEHFNLKEEKESVYFAKKWYGEGSTLVKCLSRGIGIHFGNMPEQVKSSIEKDYSSGKLKILIATSTISQGVNFPIKNLIIHSIYYGKGAALKIKDFWNLAGRAGRAGKETEGQIIFLSNNAKEMDFQRRYLDRENIEDCESMFFKILKGFNESMINEDRLQELLDNLSESYILNVLYEEFGEKIDENKIDEILENSLFKVQAKGMDLEPIKKAFRNLFFKLKQNISDEEMGKTFSKTGFSLYSNKKILSYIKNNQERIKNILKEEQGLALLKCVLESFEEKDIKEMDFLKFDIVKDKDNFIKIIDLWIKGSPIEIIIEEWNKHNLGDEKTFHLFMNNILTYQLPWGLNAFIMILAYFFKEDDNFLSDPIKNLQSYVKFGVSNPYASFLMSLGISNREVAIKISNKFEGDNFVKFIKWINNISIEDLNFWDIKNEYDLDNINLVLNKLINKEYFNQMNKEYTYFVKGIPYDNSRKEVSKEVSIGEKLSVEREYDNQYDPYAIKIFYKNKFLGYIPKDLAKAMSIQIDLEWDEYFLEVDKVENNGDYNKIKIKMNKI